MQKSLALLLLIQTILPIGSVFADEQKTIFWQTYHRPPGIIKNGDNAGHGFVQQTLKLVVSNMPEYHHVMSTTTLARSLADIKSGKNVCHPALFKTTEREQDMYFSQASMMNPTNHVIALSGTLEHLVMGNTIDLITLFSQPNLTYGLVNERSYTNSIDMTIEKYLNTSQVVKITNTDLGLLFKMIELKRVDVSIGYPFELKYYLSGSKKQELKLNAYAIANEPYYAYGSMACPKNEWGKKVISRINEVLSRLKPTTEYKNAVTTWWESDRGTARFERFYKNEFLQQ